MRPHGRKCLLAPALQVEIELGREVLHMHLTAVATDDGTLDDAQFPCEWAVQTAYFSLQYLGRIHMAFVGPRTVVTSVVLVRLSTGHVVC